MPQSARRLVLKHWKQGKTVKSTSTFTERVALMREEKWTTLLLDADELSSLRSWQSAAPIVF